MKQFRDTEYYVTEDGRVYSKKYHPIKNRNCEIKEIKLGLDRYGYLRVNIYTNKKFKTCRVHRLVAEVYLPNLNNLPEVNHHDGIKTNNNVSNLYWCTSSENTKHAFENGLQKPMKGEKHPNSKLTEEQVKWIKENYIRNHREFGGTSLSKKFDVTQSLISDIINNKLWKHLI
jgi:hypothetical protein